MVELIACAPETVASPVAVLERPEGITAELIGDQVIVEWQAPSDASAFRVRRSPDGAELDFVASPASVDVPERGVNYWFTVSALSAAGWSKSSDPSNTVQRSLNSLRAPLSVPPYSVVVAPTNAGAMLTWSSSTAEGFTLVTDPPASTLFVSGEMRTAAITALENGLSYRVGVSARHGTQDSPIAWSDPFIPASVPGSPTNVTATALPGGAVVTWSSPVDTGGAALTGWEVECQPAGAIVLVGKASTTRVEMTNLASGVPVTFTVRAINGLGLGSASVPSNVVTPEASSP